MFHKVRTLCLQALAPLLGLVGALVLAQPGLFTPTKPPSSAVDAAGIAVGMSKADVLSVLGRPTQQRGECWIWFAADQRSTYTVTFEGGKVQYCGQSVG